MSTPSHVPGEEYAGTAHLRTPEGERAVDVRLRGHFEPIDGRFHWWGRVAADAALGDTRSGATVRVRTPHGEADAQLSDVDPWGRFRLTGQGRPPF